MILFALLFLLTTLFVAAQNGTSTTSSSSSSSNTLLLVGSATSTNSRNISSTATTSAAHSTNTQPCNGYTEFCNKRYMNFTQVCAHNSAFAKQNNAASNQAISITGQLDDGIRMIQGETHWENDTLYSCHTSCDILNAGPLVNELSEVADWVRNHPYDVVTILLVNSDGRNVTDYVNSIQNSGLGPYLYVPPKVPMRANDWPTVGNMILRGKRVVIFIDAKANQTQVPYILDEFSHIWETPFSPQNASFPCTQQRPPGLSTQDAERLPYLANHNLNIGISLGASEVLIPQFAALNQTNSVNGTNGNTTGSLGEMASQCAQKWQKPPAWLLVDFYNYGNFPGSVFEVAANMNNVTYKDGTCCGRSVNGAITSSAPVAMIIALAVPLIMSWLF